MRAIVVLLAASHPAPAFAVTALSTAVAASAGRSPAGCVLVAATVLAGQLSIGWSNDVLDRDQDRAVARTDKPVAMALVRTRTVTAATAIAATACLPLSLANGWRAGSAHLVGVAGGWAYNLGLKRTWVSWLPYAVSFPLLAAFLALGLPGHPGPSAWVLVAAGLLGVGGHFLNVVPDVDADRRAGVLGLPQRLGARTSGVVGALLMAAAAAVVTLGPGGRPPTWAIVGLAGAVLTSGAAGIASRRPRSRQVFLLALATAAVTVLLLVARGSDIT